jgi:hypothetical protein
MAAAYLGVLGRAAGEEAVGGSVIVEDDDAAREANRGADEQRREVEHVLDHVLEHEHERAEPRICSTHSGAIVSLHVAHAMVWEGGLCDCATVSGGCALRSMMRHHCPVQSKMTPTASRKFLKRIRDSTTSSTKPVTFAAPTADTSCTCSVRMARPCVAFLCVGASNMSKRCFSNSSSSTIETAMLAEGGPGMVST